VEDDVLRSVAVTTTVTNKEKYVRRFVSTGAAQLLFLKTKLLVTRYYYYYYYYY